MNPPIHDRNARFPMVIVHVVNVDILSVGGQVLSAAAPDQRGKVAGWFGLSMWGGLAVGPVLAAVIDPIAGDRVTCCVIVGLGVVAATLAGTAPPQPAAAHRGRIWPGSWREVVPRGAAMPGLAFGLAAYGYGTISALLVLDLTNAVHGGAEFGLAVFAAAFLLVRLRLRSPARRWPAPVSALHSPRRSLLPSRAANIPVWATQSARPPRFGTSASSLPADRRTTRRRRWLPHCIRRGSGGRAGRARRQPGPFAYRLTRVLSPDHM